MLGARLLRVITGIALVVALAPSGIAFLTWRQKQGRNARPGAPLLSLSASTFLPALHLAPPPPHTAPPPPSPSSHVTGRGVAAHDDLATPKASMPPASLSTLPDSAAAAAYFGTGAAAAGAMPTRITLRDGAAAASYPRVGASGTVGAGGVVLSGAAGANSPSLSPPPPPPPPPHQHPRPHAVATRTNGATGGSAVASHGLANASTAAAIPRQTLCPPYLTGPACDEQMFPSCAVQWGMNMQIAPCARTLRVPGVNQFPVSCECLLECDVAGHGARIDCIQESDRLPLHDPLRKEKNISLAAYTPPWFGSPKELERIWVGGIELSYDPTLAAILRADAARSAAQHLCGGRGISSRAILRTAPLRPGDTPASLPAERCLCFPHHSTSDDGKRCEPHASVDANCINRCSKVGKCVSGVCVCPISRRGVDCSVRTDRPAVAPPGGGGSADDGGGAGGSGSRPSGSRPSPLIYVYELPAHLNTWISMPKIVSRGCSTEVDCWWVGKDPVYSIDLILLRRLMNSTHRTDDPAEADFFYIPILNSMGFHTHKFGIYMPSAPAARVIQSAVDFVRIRYPFWNRTGGSDHMIPLTGDDGSAWLRGRLPFLKDMIFLTHWGYRCNDARLRLLQPDRCIHNMGFRSHHSGDERPLMTTDDH